MPVPSTDTVATETETRTKPPPAFHIAIPPASSADDEPLIAHLVSIINSVYTIAEAGIFTPEYRRTNSSEVRSFLQSQKLALASTSTASPLSPPTNIVGCIRVSKLTRSEGGNDTLPETLGNFGTLITTPSARGSGLGRQLILFAEDWARGWGARTMQMELLVPMTFKHELKIWVQGWYERMGYRVVRLEDFGESYPGLKPLLVGETEYRVFEKGL